ncbi:protein Vhl [Sitophilus oryzae]|uniref:Protein Vhl n=1 Tax=Sitophilus oryzae TaxID=7048 RepID=A0A6J2Y796_SITOR|nr:protein Vhl [Sitophilus oryzae]
MNNIQENNDENPRSVHSTQKCYVRFVNMTERTVEIMWINFIGQYVRYRILEKGNFIDVNTYKTHPWTAKDFLTKDELHIDKRFFYHPKTTREFIQLRYPDRNNYPENHEARVRAYITLPMYSLRFLSLLTVRNHILKEDDVEQLSLPKNISDDLKRAVTKRNRECSLQALSRQL